MSVLVEVLLSTWNGERYLRPQVDSVLAQTHRELRLLVRDDGSEDGTLDVLRGYDGDERVVVRAGTNLGLPAAFFRLLDDAGDDADLWALCDQDDVWRPDKLARAVAALQTVDGPALYCGRVLVVDEQLRSLYPHELPWRGPSFTNALVQNIALGCTVVLNRQALELVRGRWPDQCVMHDAWLYLVLAATGTVLYDPHLLVDYRQHGANTVGMGRDRLSRLAGRVRRQLAADGPGRHGRQDAELLRLHSERLRPQARRELEDFLAAREKVPARLRYVLTGAAHRQTLGSDLVRRALQCCGRV